MRDLTKKEIERQDFVDNKIFELINALVPCGKTVDWDIGFIADIRERIRIEFEERKIADEIEFYPYLEKPPCKKYED